VPAAGPGDRRVGRPGGLVSGCAGNLRVGAPA